MRRYILFASILSIFWTIRLSAQSITPPVIQWQKTFGGTNNEHCWVMRQASDGGYIVAGSSESGASGNKQSTNNGGSDGWIVRLDRNGNMLWEHSIGGTNGDGFTDARQTPDGGWLLTGGGSTV